MNDMVVPSCIHGWHRLRSSYSQAQSLPGFGIEEQPAASVPAFWERDNGIDHPSLPQSGEYRAHHFSSNFQFCLFLSQSR